LLFISTSSVAQISNDELILSQLHQINIKIDRVIEQMGISNSRVSRLEERMRYVEGEIGDLSEVSDKFNHTMGVAWACGVLISSLFAVWLVWYEKRKVKRGTK
jgi:hypothetical protein